MTRIEVLNALVTDKRGKLGAIFEGKPNKDYTTEELSQIKGINDELTPLVTELEGLKAAATIEAQTAEFLGKNNPVGSQLPTGETPYGLKMPNGEVLNLKDDKGNFKSDSLIAEEIAAYAKKTAIDEPENGDGGLGTWKTAKAMAQGFVDSVAFKQYSATSRKSPEAEVEVKTLLDTTGFPIASTRSNMLIGYPTRRLVVADLMPNGNITQPRFLYMVETVNTNNAAFVAEGGTKPESALAFEEESADVRKIATVLPVTDELFADAPAMRSYVQGRLTVFLQLAEENALLSGSGVAPEIEGILTNAGIQTQAKGADTIPDALYKASTKIEVNAMLPTSGFVLHPNDWQRVRLSKDASGNYLFGSPMAGDMERIFGYPVVRTVAITEGKGLAGAFDLAAMVLRRTGINFAVSTEHSDFFIKNKLMLRVEERLAFPVFRPAGFCQVTGLNA